MPRSRGLWPGLSISLIGHLMVLAFYQGPVKTPLPNLSEGRQYQVFLMSHPDPTVHPTKQAIAAEMPDTQSVKKESPTLIEDTLTPSVAFPKDPPPRVSILQSAENFVRQQALEPDFLQRQQSTLAADEGPGNIFHPALREQMKSVSARTQNRPLNLDALNTSSITDSGERVSANNKCFRLQDLGGGAERRAWYRIKCSGKETTSEAMHRALLENIDSRQNSSW